MDVKSVSLSIMDSAEHSFLVGCQALADALREDNPYRLKESIIWVCHGVELTLKQLLIHEDPLFIFRSPEKAREKLTHLRMRRGTRRVTAVELLHPQHQLDTAAYGALVERVSTYLVVEDLLERRKLRVLLDDLVAKRNRIMHSDVELTLEEDAQQIIDVVESFVDVSSGVFEQSVFTYFFGFQLRHLMSRVRYNLDSYTTSENRHIDEVLKLLRLFRGQEVPADLFGMIAGTTIHLPDFAVAEIVQSSQADSYLVKGKHDTWLVVIRGDYINKEQMANLRSVAKQLGDVAVWVIGNTHPYRYEDIMVSDLRNIQILWQLLV